MGKPGESGKELDVPLAPDPAEEPPRGSHSSAGLWQPRAGQSLPELAR